jgi:hypothetical protein
MGRTGLMTERVDSIVMCLGTCGKIAFRLALDVPGIGHIECEAEGIFSPCIPSNILVRGSNLIAEARRVAGVAVDTEVTPDLSLVANRFRMKFTAG